MNMLKNPKKRKGGATVLHLIKTTQNQQLVMKIQQQFMSSLMVKLLKKYKNCNKIKSFIRYLQFFQLSDYLISNNWQSTMIFLKLNQDGQWMIMYTLDSQIDCSQINKSEQLLITGCRDKNIKFWVKNDNFDWMCSQLFDLKMDIFEIALNETENMLAVYGDKDMIIIIRKNISQWELAQQIKVDYSFYKMCFTFGDELVLLDCDTNCFMVYKLDQSKEQFEKVKQIKLQNEFPDSDWFPCQFIKQLGVLIIKQGLFIRIYQVNDDNNINQYKKQVQNNLFIVEKQVRMVVVIWETEKIKVLKLQFHN